MDKKYVLTGLGYAIIGLVLGIYMAATHNHGQLVTHAHIMLLGFVVSFIYGVCHRLWLVSPSRALVSAQFYLHQVGTLALLVGLFVMYSGVIAAWIQPLLAVSSLCVLAAMVLMKVLFIQASKNTN